MKKTNLKKYILEALGVLLVIAACLTVHTLSEREVYAYTEEDYKGCLKNLSYKMYIGDSLVIPDGTGINGVYDEYTGNCTDIYFQVSKIDIELDSIADSYTFNQDTWSDCTDIDFSGDKFYGKIKIEVEPTQEDSKLTWTFKVGSSATKLYPKTIYTFNNVIPVSVDNIENQTSEEEIYRIIQNKKAGINVTATTGTQVETKEIENAVEVTWKSNSESGFDLSNHNPHPIIWKGTVNSQTVDYADGTITIDTSQEVTATINVLGSSSSSTSSSSSASTSSSSSTTPAVLRYKNVEETVKDNTDLSLKITMDDDDIRAILAAQSGDLRKQIDAAVATGTQKITLRFKADDWDEDDVDKEYKGASDDLKDEAKKSNSAKIGAYFNLVIEVLIDNTRVGYITDTGSNNEVVIKCTVPNKVKNASSSSSKSSRKYRVYRYHKGDVDKVSGDWTSDTTLKIKSTLFSPYAIAYYDESSSSSSSSSSVAASNSASVRNNIDTTSGNAGSGKSPKTGDDFNPRIWIYLLIVAATIATCAGVLLHDTKDTDEAERK